VRGGWGTIAQLWGWGGFWWSYFGLQYIHVFIQSLSGGMTLVAMLNANVCHSSKPLNSFRVRMASSYKPIIVDERPYNVTQIPGQLCFVTNANMVANAQS